MPGCLQVGLQRYLSGEQLAAIRRTKIGIAGLGGLGSRVAELLVRTGFTQFALIDDDAVEPSDLNRQFYFADQVGLAKVQALDENLRRINPGIETKLLQLHLTRENSASLFAGCDAVVEAVDDPQTKRILIEELTRQGVFCVSASGLAGFGDAGSMGVRRLGSSLVMVGDFESDVAFAPPLGPKVAAAAALQADAVLEWVLRRRCLEQGS